MGVGDGCPDDIAVRPGVVPAEDRGWHETEDEEPEAMREQEIIPDEESDV